MDALKKNLNTAALVLIAAGLLGWIVWPQKKTLALAVLGLGAVALAAYIALNRTALSRTFQRKSLLYSGNLALVVLLVLAILGLANYFLARHNARVDFTSAKLHSLSGQSVAVLKALKTDVIFKGFFRTGNAGRAAMENLLKLYAYHSPRVKYEFIDPDKNPGLVKRYDVTQDGTTVIEAGDKQNRVTTTSEEDVTNALIKATRAQKKVLYFLEGHGEGSVDESGDNGYSTVKAELEKLGYEVKKQTLALADRFPRDCALLVVPGPQKDLLPNEYETIRSYIQAGGRALFMVDPETTTLLPLFLADYGFKLENDIVVDTVSRLLGGDYFMPVVTEYEPHAITDKFSFMTFFPYARSVDVGETKPEGATVTSLAKTSPNSWSERELDQKEVKLDPGQGRAGPHQPGRRLDVQDQARRPLPRSSGGEARRGGGAARLRRGRERSPHRRHRRFRLRQEPLFRRIRQRQLLPQRGQLAGRGVRPHRHPAQDANAADAAAHALAGPARPPRQPRHSAPGRPPHRCLRLGPEEVAVKFRTTLILLAVLAGLVALVLVFDKKGEEKKAADEKENALISVPAADILKASIVKNGQTLAFERDEAGPWRLTAPLQAAADEYEVNNLVGALASLRIERVVEKDAQDPAAYEIPQTEVSLWVKGQEAPVRLLVGMENPLDKSLFAKRADDPRVVLLPSSLKTTLEKPVFDFRQKDVFKFTAADVTAIRVRAGTSPGRRPVKGRAGSSRPLSPPWPPRGRSMPSSIPSPASGPRRSWPKKKRPPRSKRSDWTRPSTRSPCRSRRRKRRSSFTLHREGDNSYATTSRSAKIVNFEGTLLADLDRKVDELREKKVADFFSWNATRIALKRDGVEIAAIKEKTGDDGEMGPGRPGQRRSEPEPGRGFPPQDRRPPGRGFVDEPGPLAAYGLDPGRGDPDPRQGPAGSGERDRHPRRPGGRGKEGGRRQDPGARLPVQGRLRFPS